MIEIKVNCRLKIASGVWLGPGLFTDKDEPFDRKVYDEILTGRPTITLLSGMKEEVKRKSKGDFIAGKDFQVEELPSKSVVATTEDLGTPLDTTIQEPAIKPTSRRRRK